MRPYRRLNERISRYLEAQVVTQLSHAAALLLVGLGGVGGVHALELCGGVQGTPFLSPLD
jgi:hypothetical protein